MTSNKLYYRIPTSVVQNALLGLNLRHEYRRGGTEVGLKTAKILAKGGFVKFPFVKKVSQYFPRHQV